MCMCISGSKGKAYLARAASVGGGEAGDGGPGIGSAPELAGRRVAAADGDSGKHRVTCVGRSGQFERARWQGGSVQERIAAMLRWSVRLRRRG